MEKRNPHNMLIQLLNAIFRGEILKNFLIYILLVQSLIFRVYFLFQTLLCSRIFSAHMYLIFFSELQRDYPLLEYWSIGLLVELQYSIPWYTEVRILKSDFRIKYSLLKGIDPQDCFKRSINLNLYFWCTLMVYGIFCLIVAIFYGRTLTLTLTSAPTR